MFRLKLNIMKGGVTVRLILIERLFPGFRYAVTVDGERRVIWGHGHAKRYVIESIMK